MTTYLAHHGIKGQHWGNRRWQYTNGSLTPEGYIHYGVGQRRQNRKLQKEYNRIKQEQQKVRQKPKETDSYQLRFNLEKAIEKYGGASLIADRYLENYGRTESYTHNKIASNPNSIHNLFNEYNKSIKDPDSINTLYQKHGRDKLELYGTPQRVTDRQIQNYIKKGGRFDKDTITAYNKDGSINKVFTKIIKNEINAANELEKPKEDIASYLDYRDLNISKYRYNEKAQNYIDKYGDTAFKSLNIPKYEYDERAVFDRARALY